MCLGEQGRVCHISTEGVAKFIHVHVPPSLVSTHFTDTQYPAFALWIEEIHNVENIYTIMFKFPQQSLTMMSASMSFLCLKGSLLNVIINPALAGRIEEINTLANVHPIINCSFIFSVDNMHTCLQSFYTTCLRSFSCTQHSTCLQRF